MQLFFGLGLLASWALLFLTWAFSSDLEGCPSGACPCSFEYQFHNLYLLISLGLSIFFLCYCLIFLLKNKELKNFQKRKDSSQNLDANLITNDTTIYQLPLLQLLSKIGLVCGIGLLIFAFAMNNLSCVLEVDCPDANCMSSFQHGFGGSFIYGCLSIYFLMLTIVVLIKCYPSKYNNPSIP